MDIEYAAKLSGKKRDKWEALLFRTGLTPDHSVPVTVLIWEDDVLVAAGSRQDNILKCIAVDPDHQGEGLTATLLTHLRQNALSEGFRQVFLYTKPKNKIQFSSLFFSPIAQTDQVLLMESTQGGIRQFLSALPCPCREGNIGSIVMHCNPFTKGHRYLIETAAGECDHLYVFVLSEDRGQFPAADRLELVQAGTADFPNVTVCPTGPYLISSLTFPTYFLKDKSSAADVHCQLDVEIFLRHFVPHFGITCRYLGTEPFCRVTDRYNTILQQELPARGVALRLIPRLESQGEAISASAVRRLLGTGQPELLRQLVPDTTFAYLQSHDLI